MNVTYSTNAWGDIYAHCMSACNVNYTYYVTSGDVFSAIGAIAKEGFFGVEIFDGDLLEFEADPDSLKAVLEKAGAGLNAVYTAGSFIYDEILPEELYKIERVLALAAEFKCRHLVVGGGAKRSGGIREEDYIKLGKALDMVSELAAKYNITAGYHSHMGSLIETPEQIDKVAANSSICLCPDTAHIFLGGGDPFEITCKYIDRIRYFHLKGITNNHFSAIDSGEIDLGQIINELLRHPEIELAVEADGTGVDPETDLKNNAEFLRKYLG